VNKKHHDLDRDVFEAALKFWLTLDEYSVNNL